MIELQSIRGYDKGQRDSFEELVCQLARRQRPSRPAEFRRIEGAGGDGGVEAYWLFADGSKIGYQAKFFPRCGDIDWRQIDNSVDQAISLHPTLTGYVIALPCNLTDRSGTARRGKSGWEHWASHKAKWESRAVARVGRKIEFVSWTESEITDMLLAPNAAGLQGYWFGNIELSEHWFESQAELAFAALDERYHPEDHVDVTIQSLFEFISRHPRSRQRLEAAFTAISKARFTAGRLPEIDPVTRDDILKRSNSAVQELLTCKPEVAAPIWEPWDLEKWKRLTHDASRNVGDLDKWAWRAEEKLTAPEHKGSGHDLKYLQHDLRELQAKIRELEELLNDSALKAESARVALIEGRAGTGKSHLLGRVAALAVSEDRPVILLLGQQLGEPPLWPQVLQRLGFPQSSPDDFLAALDAASEVARVRGLILVDALNEGSGAHLWRNEIGSFLAQVGRYPNLACVLSCRSEYLKYVVPPGVLASLPRFEIRGFETPDEQADAARVYMDQRGISRPATPWLAPEFVNPLFLRSACNALKQEGKSEFPKGLTGTKAILAFFVSSVAPHESPHFQIVPKRSANTGCWSSRAAKRCMRGRKRMSGMVGMSS